MVNKTQCGLPASPCRRRYYDDYETSQLAETLGLPFLEYFFLLFRFIPSHLVSKRQKAQFNRRLDRALSPFI